MTACPRRWGGKNEHATGNSSGSRGDGHGESEPADQCGVQFWLFGGAILDLGDAEHMKQWLSMRRAVGLRAHSP